MNAWRTPQRVVAANCPDQIADVGRDRRPADTTARFPTPVQTEAAPMPAYQRLGLEDNRGFAHGREQPIEPDEDQAICSARPEPRRCGPAAGQQAAGGEMPSPLREPHAI